MSGDPLVANNLHESRRAKQAWAFAGFCQIWIWLNAAGALAFRFWVVDRFNFPTFVEERLWPSFFLLESLLQFAVVIGVCLSLFQMPRNRDLLVFSVAAAFSLLVDSVIAIAWALVAFPGEYRLATTFALFGGYLTIPAIVFALYCCLIPPRPISLCIYAVTLTIALKSAAIIVLNTPSQAFLSYTAIVVIGLLSVILPLRFGFAKAALFATERSVEEPESDDSVA